jgi:hypothetical protein
MPYRQSLSRSRILLQQPRTERVFSFALRLPEFAFVEWHASQADSDDLVNLLDRCVFSVAQNCRRPGPCCTDRSFGGEEWTV